MKAIRQHIVEFFLFIVVVVCVSACRSVKTNTHDAYSFKTDSFVKTVIQFDTTVVFAADTASLKALIECDEKGNALVAQIQELQGELAARINANIKYVNTVDTCGRVKRAVYLDILATCLEQEMTIKKLEETIKSFSEKGEARHEETVKERDNLDIITWVIVGIVIGSIGTLYISRKMFN